MIPEIGHFALWLALGVALTLGIVPLAGAQKGRPEWMALARPLTVAQFALIGEQGKPFCDVVPPTPPGPDCAPYQKRLSSPKSIL